MKTGHLPKMVAIIGGSGAGKTWLADRLQHKLGSETARLSLDSFYFDFGHLSPARRAKINFDHPSAIDWQLAENVLRHCRAGRVTDVPCYDFTTHTRLSYLQSWSPKPLILVDGLWLQPRLLELFDLKIFLDCPAQLRLERRLSRDTVERGRTPDSVRRQFFKHVAPMHELHVAPQSRWADIIFKQPANETELDEWVETIRLKLFGVHAPEMIAPLREEHYAQTT